MVSLPIDGLKLASESDQGERHATLDGVTGCGIAAPKGPALGCANSVRCVRMDGGVHGGTFTFTMLHRVVQCGQYNGFRDNGFYTRVFYGDNGSHWVTVTM